MPKKMVVITMLSPVAQAHARQLQDLFGTEVEIATVSFDSGSIDRTIEADVIIVSWYSIYVSLAKYISPASQVAIINHTITVEQYRRIMQIPAGEAVMVVNHSCEMTMETIALFNQLGINHIEFYPVYPGIGKVPKLKTAITPGEAKHVPAFVKQVIDIGNRVLDAGTIIDIAIKLKLDYMLQEDRFIDYFRSLQAYSSGIMALLGKATTLESRMDSLLNALDDGIIAVDANGLIRALNRRAEDIIGSRKEDVIDKNINDVNAQITVARVIATGQPVKARLLKINDCDISTTVVPVTVANKTTGALVIINEFTEQEKNQHKLRLQMLGKGHKAKYHFADILGQDEKIVQLVATAKNMANSDSSLLISGESGTGKELFAQAIHNASRRKDYQFVAVNCAALPESLLESELFGYEDGAFTGAKKGGKPGLFELAHKGTLFLDEIGEMALNLQARLLRVIQEREVMRIGGDRVISIDIRIISATNKDLRRLVEQGQFRRDLYYRLNVLPLQTIPLRNRPGDIMLYVRHLQHELAATFKLTPAAVTALEKYHWDGNVRELKNCVEYFAQLNRDIIDVADLPFNRDDRQHLPVVGDADHELIENLKRGVADQAEKYLFVLQSLETSYNARQRIGRRTIEKLAAENRLYLSENEIRGMLVILKSYKMVTLNAGRSGAQITPLGMQALHALNGLIG